MSDWLQNVVVRQVAKDALSGIVALAGYMRGSGPGGPVWLLNAAVAFVDRVPPGVRPRLVRVRLLFVVDDLTGIKMPLAV